MTASRSTRRVPQLGALLFAMLIGRAIGATPEVPPMAGSNNVYRIDLPTVLRLAHAQNLDVLIARERLNEARAAQAGAVAQFLPWLSPGAAFRRHEDRIQAVDGAMLDADKQSYSAGGSITAQMDLGEAIYKTLAARQLVQASNEAIDMQQQDSSLAAAQGYFELAKSRSVVEAVREAAVISQDYQKQIHEAVQAGLAFRGDELRVQTQTERYQVMLRQSLEQQRVAAARLAQILHLDPKVELVAEESDLLPLTLIDPGTALDSLVERALAVRPELRQNEALTSAAREARKGAVYGPLIPTLGAQVFAGGLGGGKEHSTGNFGPSEDYFIGLGWRIGPGGLFDLSRVKGSTARWEALRLNGLKLRDEIIRQVVENLTRVQSLSDQIQAARQNLATASETLRLTRERKQFGVGAVLEDIQAQQELTRTRLDYVNSVGEYNKAQQGLARAIGGVPEATSTPARP